MKNIIIGLIIGLLLNGLVVLAQERIVINPMQSVNTYLDTTKITTPEGTYRLFVYYSGFVGGITAVKIK